MDEAVGQVLFICVFILMAAGFFILGIYMLRHLPQVTEFFRRLGTGTFGPRIADRIYQESGVRFAAISYLVGAPLLMAFGIWKLVGILSAG